MAVQQFQSTQSADYLGLARLTHDYMMRMRATLAAIPLESVAALAGLIFSVSKHGNSVFVFGNGGSAATADHIACDLSKNTRVPGAAIVRCISLTSMVAASTAIANDDGYDRVFSDPLAIYGRKGDLALAVSTSGNSRNVVKALLVARDAGMHTSALLGFDGGKAGAIVDLPITVDQNSVPHLEDAHNVINHMLTTCVRNLLSDALTSK